MPKFDPDQSPEDRRAAFQEAIKKMQEKGETAASDGLAVLNDDQMLERTKLCGKTFKFPEQPMFGRGKRRQPPPQ